MTYKTENMLMVAQYVSSHKCVVENYNVHFRQHPRLCNIKMQRRRGSFVSMWNFIHEAITKHWHSTHPITEKANVVGDTKIPTKGYILWDLKFKH